MSRPFFPPLESRLPLSHVCYVLGDGELLGGLGLGLGIGHDVALCFAVDAVVVAKRQGWLVRLGLAMQR